MSTCTEDALDGALVGLGQIAHLEQLGIAEDGAERCSQLVADSGHELALGLVGVFRQLSRELRLNSRTEGSPFGGLEVGDIGPEAVDGPKAPAFVEDTVQAQPQVGSAAVPALHRDHLLESAGGQELLEDDRTLVRLGQEFAQSHA